MGASVLISDAEQEQTFNADGHDGCVERVVGNWCPTLPQVVGEEPRTYVKGLEELDGEGSRFGVGHGLGAVREISPDNGGGSAQGRFPCQLSPVRANGVQSERRNETVYHVYWVSEIFK